MSLKRYWWVYLTLAGVVIFILYKTFGGLNLASCFTLGTSQKKIAATAPASAVTGTAGACACTVNSLNSPCLEGGCNYT